jgi:hypothetical protein
MIHERKKNKKKTGRITGQSNDIQKLKCGVHMILEKKGKPPRTPGQRMEETRDRKFMQSGGWTDSWMFARRKGRLALVPRTGGKRMRRRPSGKFPATADGNPLWRIFWEKQNDNACGP